MTATSVATPPPARPTDETGRGVGAVAGSVPGAALGALFGAVAKLRRSKPLHPVGRVGTGLFEVTDPRPELGIPAFAQPGTHGCTVRWSRSVGLPHPLPDIEGLAIRFDDLRADLLLSGSGTGRIGRYVFAWPRLPATHGPMSTALPVRTGAGATVFLVEPDDQAPADEPPVRYLLSYATGSSALRRIGVLGASFGADRPIRFDPIRHPLPGTEQYPLVRTLREPAYLSARRTKAA